MKPPRRRGRALSGEEARLWGEVAKLITPLRGRAVPAQTPPDAARSQPSTVARRPAETPNATPLREAGRAAPSGTPPELCSDKLVAAKMPAKRRLKLGDLSPPGPAQPAPPPFKPAAPPPGLERRERQRLQRGLLPIEARIDLHGLYQAEAHAALVGFLLRARASGLARVLVVTGKGAEPGETFSERGVLRRSVPHWLRGPDLRAIVLGFEEAGRQHGGAGALYVRLRRR